MASETSIANRALSKLGEERILLLTDDVKAARTIRDMYDDVRDAELRRYPWKFALQRASLVALTAAPAGYDYQYPLPSDYLRMVQVGDQYIQINGPTPPFSIEGGRVLTNYPAPLFIRYVARIENTGLFDPLFVEAFACKLAMEACETLTQSETKFERCARAYKDAVISAMAADAFEKAPDALPYGTWLDSRGTSASDATTVYYP